MDTALQEELLRGTSLDDLHLRTSAKWRVYPGALPAWVAEMDFPIAAPIAEVLHRAVDRSDTGYRWFDEVPGALAEFAAKAWGWEIGADRVTVLADVMSGVAQALTRLGDASLPPGERWGTGVVVCPPVYPPFYSCVRDATGRDPLQVPLTEQGRLDLPALAAAFAAGARAFLMSSPHNPTGTVPTREELAALAQIAREHGVLVIADEIHAPMALPGAAHVPFLSVVDGEQPCVALVSASKAWNVPGLKCAQLVAGSEETAEQMRTRMPIEATYAIGHFGVLATIAAYRDGGPWLDAVLGILDGNRRLLADLLAEHLPLARYRQPEASYLAWVDLRGYPELGEDPAAAILERTGLALSSGPTFGAQGAGHVRVNMGTSPEILEEIVNRMAAGLQ